MISIRIYNSGNYIVNNVHPDHIEGHIEYNCTMRFGCALVVDGVIKNEGYLDKERIMKIVEGIDTSRYQRSYTPLPYH